MISIDEKFKKEIGQRLKQLRKDNKLSIEKLVDKMTENYIDINEKSIRRYEKGEILPKIDNLIYLAEIFNTTLDYIVFGKETSDDNSFTWYDTFKRLNRLVYSLVIELSMNNENGKYCYEFWDDEIKVYWERLNHFGVNINYLFYNKGGNPVFSVKDLDNLFIDFANDNEQLYPTKKRLYNHLISKGIDPEVFIQKRLKTISDKRKAD